MFYSSLADMPPQIIKNDVLHILKTEIHALLDNPENENCIEYERMKEILNCCNTIHITIVSCDE